MEDVSTFFQKRWGIVFHHPEILNDVFQHGILSKRDFQRLEFLGDRVLGLVISSWLYTLLPHETEGQLAKRFARLVSKNSLYAVASGLHLAERIFLESPKAPPPMRVVADTCEALIGALYLDQGFPTATTIVQKEWAPLLHLHMPPPIDPKSFLQEYLQNLRLPTPDYVVLHQKGPSHQPLFTIQGILPHLPHKTFIGEGHSKKEAEQNVAEKILSHLTQESL